MPVKHQPLFLITFDEEEDGRTIAEVPSLPGVMSYGSTKEEARTAVTVLALSVLAIQIKHREASQLTRAIVDSMFCTAAELAEQAVGAVP